MKNIKCTNDNILINATIQKSVIIIPNAKNKKINDSADIEKIEIIEIGDKVKDNMPYLKVGDKIITTKNLFKEISYNEDIGLPKLDPEAKIFNVYFFIKSFDIIAVVK